jgi:CO dehydrogenase nickel-insertion accessory protein CooC1
MATIHFIDGEKGGVGKSLFARVMVQYCIDRQFSYVLVEADRSNPDVGEIYPEGCERAIFSEAERKAYDADRIFDLAIKTPVIVNLPAQVFPAVTDWIERNGVLEMGTQHGVSICKWFICTGGYDSTTCLCPQLGIM